MQLFNSSVKGAIAGSLREYFFITLGLMMYAVGWVYLLLPYKITTGGLTGITALIYYATGIEIQVTYSIINSFLLILAIKVLGFKFCLKTIYAVVVLTLALWLLQKVSLHDDAGNLLQILGENQDFMACVMGSALCGLGIGIVFSENGSTGGTDIVAAIVHKYRDVSLGQMMIYCDVCIISSSYFVNHDFRSILFGVCTLFIMGSMVDRVVGSVNQSVQFFIISKHNKEIAKEINQTVRRGATIIGGKGSYTGNPVEVLMVMARKNESGAIFTLVHEIDPDAFITQNTVKGVFGQGFDTLKRRSKR